MDYLFTMFERMNWKPFSKMNLAKFLPLGIKWFEILPKLSRLFWWAVFTALHRLPIYRQEPERLYLVASQISEDDLAELKARSQFYLSVLPACKFMKRVDVNLPIILSSDPILVFGPRSKFLNWLCLRRPGTFDVDFRRNPQDGWAWSGLADYVKPDPIKFPIYQERLKQHANALKKKRGASCYVFGTGPSLDKALERDWSDGIRIVCNTIVRDPVLWNHICPDFIVAGDAIYHFGHTRFARAFRRDLRARMEKSVTQFVYPAQFHALVLREFSEWEDRLFPIPAGWHRAVNIDLTHSFRLPNLGNVLGLLLLPLACTLSKHIYLMGFDGRAPDDKLFWSNSLKHTYPEHMDELKRAHPRFFDYYVPASDPNKYVREYQGDQLEMALQHAEKMGWTFEMLHSSWTPALQKRYPGDK